ncbi:MAG: ATP-binding cassette domain-containing protein [Gammaproteobacteria bacterium]
MLVTIILCGLELAAILYFPEKFADLLSASQNPGIKILLILVLFWIFERLGLYLRELCFFPIINSSIRDMIFDVTQKIHALPYAAYENLPLLSILSAIKRVGYTVRLVFRTIILSLLPSLIKLLGVIAVCQEKMPALILVILSSMVASSIFMILYLKKYLKARKEAWQITDRVSGHIGDHLMNSIWVRENPKASFSALYEDMQIEWGAWNRQNAYQQGLVIIHTLIWGAGLLFLFLEYHSIVQLLPAKAIFTSCYLAFKHLILDAKSLPELAIDLNQITEILEKPTQTQPNSSANNSILCPTNSVLSQPYLRAENLNGWSFRLKPGEVLLIQGKSGVGKSTLLKTMAGLYPPQTGKFYFSGRIAYVPQHIKLFNKTLHENLIYGLESYDQDLLDKLLECFELKSLLKCNGLYKSIGDFGIKLSGGEQARIYLLRTVLTKPDLILLDETLHALDFGLEIKVIQYLKTIIPYIILVSHQSNIGQYCELRLILNEEPVLKLDYSLEGT